MAECRRRGLTLVVVLGALTLALGAGRSVAQQADNVSSVVRESFAVRAFEDIELPQSSVRAVHVCRRGFLWVGTREGLVRYRAGQQRVWQQAASGEDGLPSGMINTIYEDEAGTIWVGTARGVGKMPMRGDEFETVGSSSDSQSYPADIVALLPVSGELLAVAANGDVSRVAEQSQEPIPVVDGPLFDNSRGTREQHVSAAAAQGDTLFLATINEGVLQLELSEAGLRRVTRYPSSSVVIDVFADENTVIWLDRDEGFKWHALAGADTIGEAGETTAGASGAIDPLANDPQGYYRAMAAQSRDSAWFGAGPNIVRLRDGSADVVRLPGRGNEVRSITVDRVGNVWIGGYYGLYYGVDTEFDTLQTAAAYDSGVIGAMTYGNDSLFLGGQNLWVGDSSNREFREFLSVYDQPQSRALRLDPMSVGNDPVTAMDASDDLLLLGYFVGGMDVVDLNNGAVTNVLRAQDAISGESTSLDNVGVSSLTRLDETHWLATFYFYGLVEVEVTATDGAPEVRLRRLSDHDTLIGIYRITDTSFLLVDQRNLMLVETGGPEPVRLRNFDRPPPGIVFAVHPDGVGGAYLGVENTGVWHLDAAAVAEARLDPTRPTVVDRYLGQRTVWHLFLENDDTLWVTTNSGVYVFDLRNDSLLSHVTYRDGLPSNEFEYGPSASLRLPNGEKLFIAVNGPVAFREPVAPNRTPIELLWDDVTANGVSIFSKLNITDRNNATISLPFEAVNKGVVRIEYGYDNHIQALNTRYVVRVDGEGEWMPAGGPSLSLSGKTDWSTVRFEFGMRDASGGIISAPLGITVTVKPPWYMLWFLDLRFALPVLFAMIALTYVLQSRANRRQELAVAEALRKRSVVDAEMRGRLSEKEILLREIHHRVGNILSNFAANVRAMKRSAKTDETRNTLDHLDARIKVQSAVHMMLQRSDSTDINVAHMLRQVAAGARDFFGSGKNPEVELRLDDLSMTYSKAQYLGLITNELLTNSYKHAQITGGKLATVSWRLQSDGSAHFHYRDYGVGISAEAIETALTKQRRDSSGGLGQVVAMARELKGDPQIYREAGMHLRFSIPAKLLRNPPREPTDPRPQTSLRG